MTDAYCPHCRRPTSIDSHGRCMFPDCDQVVLGGTLPVVKRHAGARFISARVLREAYFDVYLQGYSIRRTAVMVLDRTEYKNASTCANQLCEQWRRMGWPLRDRIAATMAVSYRHGRLPRNPALRDRALVRERRVARGEIIDLQCAAIKTRYGKGRGERCQRAAMRGHEFCHQHDPSTRQAVHDHLARIRSHP